MKLLLPLKSVLLISSLGLLSACDQSSDVAQQKTESNATPNISVSEKKSNFFAFLQPLIIKANADVLIQREQLLDIQANISALDSDQVENLAALLKTYRVGAKLSLEQQVQALIIKVNTIPAALVLAQAANESAWGTSRFAREGNNFFGQWCFSKGCGIVPNSRNSGADHEVASYDNPFDSVKSYIRNLNSHPTYALLRTLRQQALDNDEAVSGEVLAQGLIGYSERGEEYVKEIQSMIRYNKLSRYDSPTSSTDTGQG
ncbi:MAG: glucosaminidase domain-containing protein [Oleispira sp.]